MTLCVKQPFLWGGLACALLVAGVVHADPYIHASVGQGDTSQTQWGVGVGYDVAHSPWGVEVNARVLPFEAVGVQEVAHQWGALSATYRFENVGVDGLTLKGGLGVATIFTNKQGPYLNNNDFSFDITPNVEVSYRLSQHWDVFADYRYFMNTVAQGNGENASLSSLSLGARLYWTRSAPALSVMNDADVTPAMAQLRDATLAQATQMSDVLDGAGVSASSSQFLVNDEALSVHWTTLRVSVDDNDAFELPLEEAVATLSQRLPRGQHALTLTLLGEDRESGAPRTLQATRSVHLYSSQGLNFLLSVQDHLLGEELDVQVF